MVAGEEPFQCLELCVGALCHHNKDKMSNLNAHIDQFAAPQASVAGHTNLHLHLLAATTRQLMKSITNWEIQHLNMLLWRLC